MTIESPETYGEHYWKSQIEAATAFSEVEEESIKPLIPNLFTDASIRAAVPFDILPKLERLFEFEHAGLGGVGGRFLTGAADNVVGKLLDSALKDFGWATGSFFQDEHVVPEQMATLKRRKRISDDFWNKRMSQAGYSDGERLVFYDSTAPFPAPADMMRWGRWQAGSDKQKDVVQAFFDMPESHWNIWVWLSQQVYTTEQITTMFKRKDIIDSEYFDMMDRVGWDRSEAEHISSLSYTIPNAMLLLQAALHQKKDKSDVFDDLGVSDIHPNYQQKYWDAVLTKPASSDMVAYNLRQENDLADLDEHLKQIGVHPDWLQVYRTLADRIPPVADIISMAVREAFSPSIAARFGQYEDFPEEFARYAKQQGLSEDWARRYWAAHWGLPSPQQGFEMLHRGVITDGDLELLMKAQDIMPFWRDKMTAIAYNTLTRVDVRRMYQLGVLDRKGVLESYKDAGYSDKNAERMTEFTDKYVKESQTKSAQSDIIKAFSSRMIDRSEASSLLMRIGLRTDLADYLLDDIEYKREWDRIDAQIKGIKNLYKKGQYDQDITIAELSKLDLPADTIELLMQEWWYEIKGTETKTWSKAETVNFMKSGAITKERGERELYMMGYDQEHVDAYMGAIEWS